MPAPSGRLSRRYQATVSGVVYRSARPVPAGQNNHGEALGLIRSGPDAGMPDLQIMFVDVPLRAETLPGPAIAERAASLIQAAGMSLPEPDRRQSPTALLRTAGSR
jgi:hypothetical protein